MYTNGIDCHHTLSNRHITCERLRQRTAWNSIRWICYRRKLCQRHRQTRTRFHVRRQENLEQSNSAGWRVKIIWYCYVWMAGYQKSAQYRRSDWILAEKYNLCKKCYIVLVRSVYILDCHSHAHGSTVIVRLVQYASLCPEIHVDKGSLTTGISCIDRIDALHSLIFWRISPRPLIIYSQF